jgi:hypothetical protein
MLLLLFDHLLYLSGSILCSLLGRYCALKSTQRFTAAACLQPEAADTVTTVDLKHCASAVCLSTDVWLRLPARPERHASHHPVSHHVSR